MSARNAGIWLAAQGALAVIRLSIWIIDPAFDDHEFHPGVHDGSALSELRLGLISDAYTYTQFRIPVWAAQLLQGTNYKYYEPFTMALSTYLGKQSGVDIMAKIQNAKEYWDIPGDLFNVWVYTHSHPDPLQALPLERCNGGARVIVDNDGSCHVLPFYILEKYSYEERVTYELKLFGNLKDEASTVICIRKMIYGQPLGPEGFTVGLQTPIGIELDYTVEPISAEQFIDDNFQAWRSSRAPDGSINDGVRDDVIKTMDTMWNYLKSIFKGRHKYAGLPTDVPDIFLHEEESNAPAPPEIRAEPISADSETPNIRRRRQSC